MEQFLRGNLEENIITLLCWSDSASPAIRLKTAPSLFSTAAYQYIAEACFDYIDEYRIPPKDHIADLLEHLMKTDSPIARLLISTITNMRNLFETLNEDYVLNGLDKFLKTRYLQKSIEEASLKLAQGDTDGAEETLRTVRNINELSIGTLFNDPLDSLSFLKQGEEDVFLTGIQHLDYEGISPKRKQLFLIMAPTGRGKTWGLVHFGKMAVLNGKKVLHVTLEMDEKEVSQRYTQSFFSLVSSHSVGVHLEGGTHTVSIPTLVLDGNGELMEITTEKHDRLVLSADNEFEILKKMGRLKQRAPLRIKEFPSGYLTIHQLSSYLDLLETSQKFTPDVLILDYPDIMGRPGRDDKRNEIGDLYIQLRGLAAQRNMYLITATQTNRLSMSARTIKESHVAEDISKIATSDYVVSLNQTDNEKELGLCRLFVAKARYSRSGFQIIMTQNYGIGQFCLESLASTPAYESLFGRISPIGEGAIND